MAHEDFIRVRNLEDSDTECFQGFGCFSSGDGGGSLPTAPGLPGIPAFPGEPPMAPISPGGAPVTQSEKKAFDLKNAWKAQQKLTGTMIDFLDGLDPGDNIAVGNLIADYLGLLEATKGFSASLDAFQVSRDALAEFPQILRAIDRKPSAELIQLDKDTDDLFKKFSSWLDAGMEALYGKETAQTKVEAAKQQLAAATSDEEVMAANAAIETANAELFTAEEAAAAADRQLPAVIPIIDTLDISLLIGAIATLNPAAIAVFAGKFLLKTLLNIIIRWVEGKLTGRKPTQDLQPIVDALRDLALQDATIKFGDNAALHIKAALLEY